MADFMLFGLFDNVETTADVIEEVRGLGIDDKQVEVMSNVPYAAKFFGRTSPRLWFLPFALMGAGGGALIAFFIVVITPWLYPVRVGSQPLIAPFPPSAIMFFEFMALGTMVMSFVGFLIQNRFPILTRQMYDERITDGYIGVEVKAPSSLVDQVADIFETHHAHLVKREDVAFYPPQGKRHLLVWGAVSAAGLVAVLIPLLITYEVVKPPWINTMKNTVVIKGQEGPRLAAPDEAIPIHGPVLIAGQPATRPLPDTPESIARGQTLFSINCSPCHGDQGGGDGLLTKHFPETPALTSERVQSLSDDDIFLVVTNGRNRMPSLAESLSAGDTWDIINYVRSLGQ